MLKRLTVLLCTTFLALPFATLAQDNGIAFNGSRLPVEANDVRDFVPSGWTIEEQVAGDLNGDATADIALKLIQEKRAGASEDEVVERRRTLVILFKSGGGKLRRAAVAEKLLQCTSCGGAFYGVSEAPANVKIERGVLVVNQDGGSRNVVERTFRFRYDGASRKFMLIGFDMTDRDRASGEATRESTNFLTGKKEITIIKLSTRGGRDQPKTTNQTVAKKRETIEQFDYENY